GADHVIDYTLGDFTRAGLRYDRILDAGGNGSVFAARRALVPNGVYRSFGGRGPSTGHILMTLVGGLLLSVGRTGKIGLLTDWKPNDAADMAAIGAMLVAGTLNPVIDRTFGLAEVPEALRYVAAGNARGKVVIAIGG
ncbi:MAG: zinc-binding dehydrogenase, partial [Candidatus Limnocylindrales bacterium]